MTNPNNAVGTPAALNGRTSVEAFNDLTQMLTSGILSGWAVSPSSGMTVSIGGASGIRDVAIAENPSGLLTTVNNISKTPIPLTIATASTTSSRVDSIVAYVNSPASSSAAATDNPSVCGLLDVQGTTSAPTEEMIRSAITNDGGTGTTAYYVVLATISIPANTTTITWSNITDGNKSSLASLVISSENIADDAITSSKISNGAVGTAQIANSAITNAKMASNSVNTAQIANSAITNAKISTKAVESDNVNFATFAEFNPSRTILATSNIEISGNNSYKQVGSAVTIQNSDSQNHTYLVFASLVSQCPNGEKRFVLRANGSDISSETYDVVEAWSTTSLIGTVTVASGSSSVVKLYARSFGGATVTVLANGDYPNQRPAITYFAIV